MTITFFQSFGYGSLCRFRYKRLLLPYSNGLNGKALP